MNIMHITPALLCVLALVSGVLGDGGLQTVQSCDDGWLSTMNRCYYWGQGEEVQWAEARQECHSRGAELLTISNDDEQNWVNIQTEEYSTDGWWIGLRYNSVENVFQWVTMGAKFVSTLNWNKEPDNYDGQNCVSISEYGMFSDNFCYSKYGYICKVNKTSDQACPDSSQGPNWAFLDTACYWIADPADPTQLLSWSDARAACQKLKVNGLPMDLLAVNLDVELSFFQTELSDRSNDGVNIPWWTGLNDQAQVHFYVWVDNSFWNASLTPWDSAPNNDPAQSCGLMSSGGVIDDVKCDARAQYVCEKSALKPVLDVGCPDKWVRGGHSCYHFATIKGFPWLQARHYCQTGGADLLKVDSQSEKYWLENMHIGTVGYWTGLNDRDKEGDWRWADGNTYDTSMVKWNQEPNDLMGNEDCAQIGRDGVLNDIACVSKAGFICEYVLDPGAQCIQGWVEYPGKGCYYISSSNASEQLMWYDVQQHCLDVVRAQNRDLQAFYLALETKDEETWLVGQLQKQPLSAVQWWTGLTDSAVEGVWLWATDFSNPPDTSLLNWAGEPNNFNGNEDCAILYQGGRYNDLNCDTPAYFICEKAAGRGSTLNFSICLLLLCLLMTWFGTTHFHS